MARVTVTDCLNNVENRFQLVLVAAKRARQLALGAEAFVEEDNDKPSVIALREIAEDFVGPAILDPRVSLSGVEYSETPSTDEAFSDNHEMIQRESSEPSTTLETDA